MTRQDQTLLLKSHLRKHLVEHQMYVKAEEWLRLIPPAAASANVSTPATSAEEVQTFKSDIDIHQHPHVTHQLAGEVVVEDNWALLLSVPHQPHVYYVHFTQTFMKDKQCKIRVDDGWHSDSWFAFKPQISVWIVLIGAGSTRRPAPGLTSSLSWYLQVRRSFTSWSRIWDVALTVDTQAQRINVSLRVQNASMKYDKWSRLSIDRVRRSRTPLHHGYHGLFPHPCVTVWVYWRETKRAFPSAFNTPGLSFRTGTELPEKNIVILW